jgi:integral membrane sensor domain MASE1
MNRMNPPQLLPYAGRVALLAAAYYLTGRLGLTLPAVGASITLVWPPSGIAVAALLRWGPRHWPGVWLGALLVNLPGSPALVAAGSASATRSAPRWGRCCCCAPASAPASTAPATCSPSW